MAKVRITKVKSEIDRNQRQKDTLKALGLRKLNQSREVELNDAVKGQIDKVKHLLKVENLL